MLIAATQLKWEGKGGLAVSRFKSPSGFGWEVIHSIQGGFATNGASSCDLGDRGDALPAKNLMLELTGSCHAMPLALERDGSQL